MERRGWPGGQILGLVLALAAGLPMVAHADVTHYVSVSATVPSEPPFPTYPVVQLNGGASPLAVMTVTRDVTPLVVPPANSNGLFAITLSDQPVGEHTYVIAGTDSDGQNLSPITIILDLQYSTTTTIDNLILGPTIDVIDAVVDLNGTVGVAGQSVVGSTVEITYTGATTVIRSVIADGQGRWTDTVVASALGVGTVVIQAITTYNSVASVPSREVAVVISSVPPPTNGNVNTNTNQNLNTNVNTNTPTNTNTPSNTNRPPPIITFVSADINVDRRVNVVDFSILMYFWNDRDPDNPRTDINRDGRVDLIDFSILLYQWTG